MRIFTISFYPVIKLFSMCSAVYSFKIAQKIEILTSWSECTLAPIVKLSIYSKYYAKHSSIIIPDRMSWSISSFKSPSGNEDTIATSPFPIFIYINWIAIKKQNWMNVLNTNDILFGWCFVFGLSALFYLFLCFDCLAYLKIVTKLKSMLFYGTPSTIRMGKN